MNTQTLQKFKARHFAMYSNEGNVRVGALVDKITTLPSTVTDQQIYAFLTEGMEEIAKAHGEVWDVAVREHIVSAVELEMGRELTAYF